MGVSAAKAVAECSRSGDARGSPSRIIRSRTDAPRTYRFSSSRAGGRGPGAGGRGAGAILGGACLTAAAGGGSGRRSSTLGGGATRSSAFGGSGRASGLGSTRGGSAFGASCCTRRGSSAGVLSSTRGDGSLPISFARGASPGRGVDRVGHQPDRRRRSRRHGRTAAGRPERSAIAAAVLAAWAALSVTIAPASVSLARCRSSPCWSARAPST